VEKMEMDPKMEVGHISTEWYEEPLFSNTLIILRIKQLKTFNASDKKFAYQIYKTLTSEVNNNDLNDSTIKLIQEITDNKLSKMLEEQKYETLERTLNLISSIHNMTNADDYETILNEANFNVMVDKQKRQIQQINRDESREEIKVIGELLNYTFYELLERDKVVTMTRWYDSTRSRLQAIRMLIKLYDEIESGRFNESTDLAKEKYKITINAELCMGLNMR
jgi:hypothetical protein